MRRDSSTPPLAAELYRDAMSLEQCFAIIEQGSSQDFNPLIAEVFLECREKVEQIHNGIRTKQKEKIL